jgi:hypothetical protein
MFLTGMATGDCSAGDGLAVASGALGVRVWCGATVGSGAVVGAGVRVDSGADAFGAGAVLGTGADFDPSSAEAPSCIAPHVRRAVTPSSSVPTKTAGLRGAQVGRAETRVTAEAVTRLL